VLFRWGEKHRDSPLVGAGLIAKLVQASFVLLASQQCVGEENHWESDHWKRSWQCTTPSPNTMRKKGTGCTEVTLCERRIAISLQRGTPPAADGICPPTVGNEYRAVEHESMPRIMHDVAPLACRKVDAQSCPLRPRPSLDRRSARERDRSNGKPYISA